MRIFVDIEVCEAHGECVRVAPEIFRLGSDDEVVTLLQDEIGEGLRENAEIAVRMCPVTAIALEE